MRKLVLSILAIATFLLGYAQTKTCEIPRYKNGEVALWYTWTQENNTKAGLPDLTQSSDTLHFRFSTETQAIDIWTKDYKSFRGTFANHTTSEPCRDCLIKGKSKYYSRKYDLDSSTAREVYELFCKLSIFSIPNQDSIKGWTSGYDGEEFLIECSTPSHYSFKEYWSPDGFKNEIKEAALIDSLANQLKSKLEMNTSFYAFIDLLPSGTYHAGSYVVIWHNLNRDFIINKFD